MEKLNKLFLSWKHSRTRLEVFYDEFKSYCLKVISKILKNYALSKIQPAEFEELVPEIFMYAVEHYDSSKIEFDKYVAFILSRKLIREINSRFYPNGNLVLSLDRLTEDGTPIIELIEDNKSNSLRNEISYDNYKLELCSPKKDESIRERRCRLIMHYLMQGYSRREIIKTLNITVSQYRSCQYSIKHNKKVNSFKMELK